MKHGHEDEGMSRETFRDTRSYEFQKWTVSSEQGNQLNEQRSGVRRFHFVERVKEEFDVVSLHKC